MPIPIIRKGVEEGLSSIPYVYTVLRIVPWVLLVAALKYWFGGARNRSERLMHSKVVMITGGTSGIGASVAHELALRGAQVILLTQHSPSDIFLVEYVEDLRKSTGNQLIYAEQVDLSSLYSIRTFATKWIDNAPPRRLDMLILCANTVVPSKGERKITVDALDEEWQVNYLANFHLLSILSPALRAQPAHRDVRVIFTTCPSYIGAEFDLRKAVIEDKPAKPNKKPKTVTAAKKKDNGLFALSKLSLMIFAQSFQAHLNTYKRPDGQPPCTRVITVDPGFSRTPGTRRWLTGGSLWGLLLYLLTWPLWWLILKSPQQGAQSILYAAMEARYGKDQGGWMIKECREVDFSRKDVKDEQRAKELWEFSEKQIELREKEGAVLRAIEKKEREEEEKRKAEDKGAAKDPTPGSRRSRKAK
ncbi:putative oxidoreductase [Aspergillus ruber CBS 135680]|uniref:NAD(P)-binding protein n=1 Tax=Aspergillus ruber (strain CBS 135680) TaxID=1388766 RepID=A0A017SG76_ASPRC|nr:NAD(P)-binding protein [Aspergillus ruber CBS 135680]EYE95756.1 NAD(P)-binding protein [Aspergillus ruber CBS 135680]